jgi:DNA-directed RNA polymerase specialized sigma24 family protein
MGETRKIHSHTAPIAARQKERKMNFSEEAEAAAKIVTDSQLSRLASRHGLGVEAVEDIRQEVILRLLEGTSPFDPEKGKFENWLRTTISRECQQTRCGRAVSIEEFEGEGAAGEVFLDFVEFDNFLVAENNEEFDLNRIHSEHGLGGEFWDAAASREGWAERHDLTLKGGDMLADRLVEQARAMLAEGLAPAEILALLDFNNPVCQRQRRPKIATANLAVGQKQIGLF